MTDHSRHRARSTDHQEGITTALVSRQAAMPAPTAPSAQPAGGLMSQLGERLQVANAISKAGNMLPKCYQNQPGAVLLLMSWAEKHGKDLLTAGQGVQVNDQGQLVVMAEMRVELATDKGYDIVDVTDDSVRRTECTVEVRGPGLPPEGRRLTVRLEDIHESIRSLTTKNGKPTPWATSPEDMLLRTAQRRADKRYCRTAAAQIDHTDDQLPDDDPVAVLTAGLSPAPDGLPAEPEPQAPTEEEARAQAVDDLTAPPPEPVTAEQLRAAGKVAELVRTATKLRGSTVAVVDDIVADQALARAVLKELSR